MKSLGLKGIWLATAFAVLLPMGCASQRGRMASKQEINTAQLLAAARQYEKEGNLQSAGKIYKHVLTFHPANSEAKQGLALVQQGKLRVSYDTETLLASNDLSIQTNPQARLQLAKNQKAKVERVNDRMAQLIAQAAENPQKIEVDPTPAKTMIASASSQPTPIPRVPAPAPAPVEKAPTRVAQAKATETVPVADDIEVTAFEESEKEEPADWANEDWQSSCLTNKCLDASAAVLREVKKLESKSDDVRKDGLARLALMGTEAKTATPAIQRLIADPNELVAAHAAWAIWETDGDASASVPTLQQLLSSKSTDVVQFAAYTLGNIGEDADAATLPLRGLLRDDSSLTRLHAAEAITRISEGDDRAAATDALIVLLNNEDTGVRHLAAIALGEADSDNAEIAILALTGALDDADAGVRSAAALALGAFGEQAGSAISKLEEAADTDRTDVREAAETALACIKL